MKVPDLSAIYFPGLQREQAIEQDSDKFVSALSFNPHRGMEETRILERLARNHGVETAKVIAHTIQKLYNDKIYNPIYPIYAKCIEPDFHYPNKGDACEDYRSA